MSYRYCSQQNSGQVAHKKLQKLGHKSNTNCVPIPNICVCHECVLPTQYKQNMNLKIAGSSQKIIEHLKDMPSCIERTVLFWAILANLPSNGNDKL